MNRTTELVDRLNACRKCADVVKGNVSLVVDERLKEEQVPAILMLLDREHAKHVR